MRTVGIKLADQTFYPVMEEGSAQEKTLDLTTAHNNQTCVMVDMYRSKTCSMDDAEYIDTLKIDNLIAHPNGEPDITFSVCLDENNQLSAKIIDSETGAQSKSTITLISRTIEERLQADDYTISHSGNTIESTLDKADDSNDSEKTADELKDVEITEEPSEYENNRSGNTIAVVAGGGLLAAASALQKNNEINSKNQKNDEEKTTAKEDTPEISVIDPIEEETEETSVNESELVEEDDFNLGDPSYNSPDFMLTENNSGEVDEFTLDESDEEFTDDNLSIPDFNVFDTPAAEENPEPKEDFVAEEAPADSDEMNDLSIADETTSEDPLADLGDMNDFNISDETASEDPLADLDDMNDFNISDETASEDPLADLGDMNDFNIPDETTSEDPLADLGDMNDFNISDETASEDPLADLGDMNDFNIPDEPEPTKFADFNIPDLEENSYSNFATGLDDEDDLFADDMPVASGGLSFTGLYDKETEMGESYEDDSSRKRTKVPVIICVICAIICLLATLALLFLIPSKYNLRSKVSEKETTVVESTQEVKEEQPAEEIKEPEEIPPAAVEETEEPEEPVTEPKETVPASKEDEVIIIVEAEKVVPLPPPVEKVEPIVVTYKIKWGDTLWDIAETYYKNPWRYKFIARYNNIKNPDHIVSGTTIQIPQE